MSEAERESIVTRLVWRPWLQLFVQTLLLAFLVSAIILALRPIAADVEWPLRIVWALWVIWRVNRMPWTMLCARVYYTGQGWVAQDIYRLGVTGEGLTREDAISAAKRRWAWDVLHHCR